MSSFYEMIDKIYSQTIQLFPKTMIKLSDSNKKYTMHFVDDTLLHDQQLLSKICLINGNHNQENNKHKSIMSSFV